LNNNKTKIDYTDKFSLASPKKQILYPVSQRDWERLKTMVKNIVAHSNWCQIIWSTSIGIFVMSVFTLIGFYYSKEPVNWTITLGWVILGISLVLSLAGFIFDRFRKKYSCFARDQIVDELESIENSFDVTEDEEIAEGNLLDIVIKNKWRLVFNPSTGRSKLMRFDKNGVIRDGKNNNESSWKIQNKMLEIFNYEGEIFSRFTFETKTYRFIHTNDEDTKSIRGQYMILEN